MNKFKEDADVKTVIIDNVEYTLVPVNTEEKVSKPEFEQWEPEGGEHVLDYDNTAEQAPTCNSARLAGRERATQELAKQAANASRERDRLEAFRDQYWSGWKADWENKKQGKYQVYINNTTGIASSKAFFNARTLGTVYGPKEFAEEAAKMINSGKLLF